MVVYGRRSGACEDREPFDDSGNIIAAQAQTEGGNQVPLSPKRSQWAWANARGHHDWMDSHTPFAYHDQ
ncbi:hypothetical protein LMG23994_06750 [Cupriavidus pinatubonensis]|uniref:Uncharacterized protein n=1 Tax=Cupriavidus pinatubonensis TaxID=248026 RepID=A0ABM8Y3H0_9BURK|nr:hypothetical protein LMG23994_06750 [Cupriavidus pinatubonensis]